MLQLAARIAPDVKACPCRTIVPLYRHHVFAQLKPTTNSRLDVGLLLVHYKGKLPKRLVETLKTAGDIDLDVEKWLQIAYDLDRD